jgi:CAAX prenyl protease-like protein
VFAVWLLNVIRICGFILIGNLGASDMALTGFHSQAGWIAFTAVSLAFSMATRKMMWVRRIPVVVPGGASGHNTALFIDTTSAVEQGNGESQRTSAYIVPFLSIVIMSIASNVSGHAEWLYPMCLTATGFALWHYRRSYVNLAWKISWTAPAIGVGLFACRLLLTLWMKDHPAVSVLGSAVVRFSPAARAAWISLSAVAVVLVIPIAEELAFRGFLAPRLVSREFDSVRLVDLTLVAVVVSSIVYGVTQGQDWRYGILAGLAYVLLAKKSGRISDAVVAHATTNLMLAIWVITRGDWGQW